MYKFLRNPVTNAVGIFLFSGFYALMFFLFSDKIIAGATEGVGGFWLGWDRFLQRGGFRYAAAALVLLTIGVIAILLVRHKPYDEYHTGILVKCLALSVVLTLLAIGAFFLLILLEPVGFLSKLVLFVTINWATVVIDNLAYLLLCRRR